MAKNPASQFRDRTERVDALLARPGLRERVDAVRGQMREADQAYALSLAVVRNAARLTQADLARTLRVSQGAIAQTEARTDLLLSTLRSYIEATGSSLRLLVQLPDGRTVELNLDSEEPDPHPRPRRTRQDDTPPDAPARRRTKAPSTASRSARAD